MKFQPLFKSLAMFVLVHNIRPVFSFMGRNRKSLGGQWGESVMTTMMAEYNTGKHMKGNKKTKKPSTYHPSSDSDFYVTKPGHSHSQSPTPTKKRNEPLYKPKTVNQELYLRFLNDDNVKIVLGVGPAGCGKTLFACHRAIEELRSGNIEKIVVTRPMVAVEDESVGFLPGDMNQKMAPWTRPIFDIFGEYYDVDDLNEMVRKGVIEISPLAYMRGRTFKNSFIIADEMQNSTPNQMMMVTTRLGQDSKMVITGDLKQSDRGRDNGLVDFLGKVKAAGPSQGFGYVELGTSDVQRSAIVARVLDMYSPPPVTDTANKEKIRGAIQTLLREPDAAKKKDATKKKDAAKKIYPEQDAAMLPSYEIPKNDTGRLV